MGLGLPLLQHGKLRVSAVNFWAGSKLPQYGFLTRRRTPDPRA